MLAAKGLEIRTLIARPVVVAATLVVAASDSLHPERADLKCTGINDHLVIQAALDALPATGGEVYLLDGTYNIEVALVLDSYQTLRGSGRNTILTTTTADVDIITATGGAGTEKVGITIADLCIDGNAGGVANDHGILWTYVDYSRIENVFAQDNGEDGIRLVHCDFCILQANTANGNTWQGIRLDDVDNSIVVANTADSNTDTGIYFSDSYYCSIAGNVCNGNGGHGIKSDYSYHCTIVGNTCEGNTSSGIVAAGTHLSISENICKGNGDDGIYADDLTRSTLSANICSGNGSDGIVIYGPYNTIDGNICELNDEHGIQIWHDDIIVSNNVCVANSQATDNTYDNIFVDGGWYDLIADNICRMGALANQPRYGINIDSGIKNIVQGNDLHDAGLTANFNDGGTCTIVQEDNCEIGVPQVKRYVYMKNTSGGALAAGDVVVFKAAVAAGDEFTTTVVLGDDHVLGMVAEAIADNAYGYVLIAGKTVVLQGSNDNGNIAIGDFLCASDTATEAVLAGAGHTTFAIALEACAAANCAIDALLINPLTF